MSGQEKQLSGIKFVWMEGRQSVNSLVGLGGQWALRLSRNRVDKFIDSRCQDNCLDLPITQMHAGAIKPFSGGWRTQVALSGQQFLIVITFTLGHSTSDCF